MKYERRFFAAVREGDIPFIEKALAEGIPVDHFSKFKRGLRNLTGKTGLVWATFDGNLEVVSALLASGASPDVKEFVPNIYEFPDEQGARVRKHLKCYFSQPLVRGTCSREIGWLLFVGWLLPAAIWTHKMRRGEQR